MATATLPYGSFQPPALNLYAPQQTDAEYQALKRTYLGLLLPQQIIDICLSFEAYAPHQVRLSVWPLDLKSAVAALQQRRSPQQAPSNLPATSDSPSSIAQPLHSQPSPRKSPATEGRQASQPAPPDKPPEIDGIRTQTQGASSSSPPQPIPIAHPVSVTLPHPTPIQPPTAQSAYPHQPYGYSQPTASYPHVPYYGAATTTYSYPHASYPTFPPSVSYSQHARKSPEPFPNLTSRQSSEKKIPPEDIPSYEEIIAEALSECADPEGAVPKNIFTWMAARYPLQSNFRPSASQALQKAFKRGRFEKSMTGKYRLNRRWEGMPAPRRARRPEKQGVASTSVQPAGSPFTRAPLEHRRSTSENAEPSSSGHQGPYTYPPPEQIFPQSSAMPSQDSAGHASHEDIGEGSEAWVAAQNILKAINFGSLIDISRGVTGDAGSGVDGVGQQQLMPPPPPPPPPAQPLTNESSPSTLATPALRAPAVELNPQDRAALQAQLALLAAQMVELAEDGGEEALAEKLSSAMAGVPLTRVVIDEDYDEEEEDSDADMEQVHVPDVVRTA